MKKYIKGTQWIFVVITSATYCCILFLSILASMDFYSNYSENIGSYIGGILSFLGGVSGALGAVLIARYQLSKQFKDQLALQEKQIQLQNETDRNRIMLELEIQKCNEFLKLLLDLNTTFEKLNGKTLALIQIRKNITMQDLKLKLPSDITSEIEKMRDEFHTIHLNIPLYGVFFKDIIKFYKKDVEGTFDEFSEKLNRVVANYQVVNDNQIDIYKGLMRKAHGDIEELINKVNLTLEVSIQEFKTKY